MANENKKNVEALNDEDLKNASGGVYNYESPLKKKEKTEFEKNMEKFYQDHPEELALKKLREHSTPMG